MHLDFDYVEYLQNLNEYEKKNAPANLYWKGDPSLLTEGRRVSVVGSRKATEDGLRRANLVTKRLVENDIVVVSGLAEGIDTMAHKTAIAQGGKTIAVLGTPLSKAYPTSNKALLEEIKLRHLAISQFGENGANFGKNSFPMRNRTMALISDATIIIEAEENSGTKHQGWEALRLSRTLFILENVLKGNGANWAKEMIKFGARILTQGNILNEILEIPSVTSIVQFDEY